MDLISKYARQKNRVGLFLASRRSQPHLYIFQEMVDMEQGSVLKQNANHHCLGQWQGKRLAARTELLKRKILTGRRYRAIGGAEGVGCGKKHHEEYSSAWLRY